MQLATEIRQMQGDGVSIDQAAGEAEAYLVTFLSKLLYQREKIELGLLDHVLPDNIRSAWHDFLITVECNRRYNLE